jgi:hypothetical protein
MHQIMLYWQAAHQLPGQPSYVQGFTRIWETADKIVFSTRLASAYGEVTARAHLQPGMIRQLKQAVDRDMTVGGRTWPHRPSRPLVDELQLFLVPATVGGGKPTLLAGMRPDLELLDTRTSTLRRCVPEISPQASLNSLH